MDKIYKIDEMYTLQVISDFSDLSELQNTWNSLAEMQNSYQPWLSFDWFRLFTHYFLNGSQLFIVLIYRKTQLVTIAPFALKRKKYKGILTVNLIELLGNHYSPIRNLLFRESDDRAIRKSLKYLLHFFSTIYKDWTIIEIDSMPVEERSFNIFKDSIETFDFIYREYPYCTNFYIDKINSSGEEYIKRRSKNTRHKLGKMKRRLERRGELTLEIGLTEDKFDYYMELYYSIRKKSWKAPEANKAFHKDFWRMTIQKGWLRCAFLFHDEIAIASLLIIVYQQSAYLLEANYDQKFTKFSPGIILIGEMAKYLINVDKVTEINAMGGNQAYKRSWFPKERERMNITVFNKGMKGKVLGFVMTSILPLFEKNPFLMSARKVLSRIFKDYI